MIYCNRFLKNPRRCKTKDILELHKDILKMQSREEFHKLPSDCELLNHPNPELFQELKARREERISLHQRQQELWSATLIMTDIELMNRKK